jgi:asparagine synthase (glutamine-hydrolysing)
MCGILGLAGPGAGGRRAAFPEALDVLAHRRPDDRGVLNGGVALLGHRRLSILDLSPAGHQPMVDSGTGAGNHLFRFPGTEFWMRECLA